MGLYVLAGNVASCKAGPAVIISFALAALASAFSALCYAEFAGRVPRAGSAYVYSYITVGELVAFVIGWNMILEYVIGAAAVTRGFSGYIRFVVDHIMEASRQQANLSDANLTEASSLTFPRIANSPICRSQIETGGLLASFDWLAVVLIVAITLLILFGVRHSTKVTLIFTLLNLLVVATIVVSGMTIADFKNWNLSPESIPKGFGSGGFLPFGWTGVLAGSATCFFGFIGFDTIASSAEEARNPKRNVPLSILLSLFISFLAYMAIATVQTLIWPYYDQNRDTILPHVFKEYNMPVSYWIVTVGAIAGLASSQLAGMYPLPRTLYSMSYDKLIYAYLSKISKKFRLPVRSIIIGSILVAIPAAFLKTEDLADMVSIGTLAAYSLVSLSVLILRYEFREDTVDDATILAGHLNFVEIFDVLDQQQTGTGEPNGLQQLNGNPANMSTEMKSTPLTQPPANHRVDLRPNKGSEEAKINFKETGSRTLTPQLSVGFYSWFRKSGEESTPTQDPSPTGVAVAKRPTRKSSKWQNLLELLIVWRSDPDSSRNRRPTHETSELSRILMAAIVILSIAFDLVAQLLVQVGSSEEMSLGASSRSPTLAISNGIDSMKTFLACTNCILIVLLAAAILMLSRLPRNRDPQGDSFQVPLVPLVPTLSIVVNTFLMLNLNYLTWVRFTVWMTVGFFIYFSYGIWNSEGYLLYSLDR